jgi:hypothetical protein
MIVGYQFRLFRFSADGLRIGSIGSMGSIGFIG